MVSMTVKLGAELAAARAAQGRSLQAVGDQAKVSQAYLHKLEAGRVGSPNPRILARLADTLQLPYLRLMELADYLLTDAAHGQGSVAAQSSAAPQPAPSTGPSAAGNADSPSRSLRPATNDELLSVLRQMKNDLKELREGQKRLETRLRQLTPKG
jgi:transcriptional regulator with XRE-family HTH domain